MSDIRKCSVESKKLSVEVDPENGFTETVVKSGTRKLDVLKSCTNVVKDNLKALSRKSSLHGGEYEENSRLEKENSVETKELSVEVDPANGVIKTSVKSKKRKLEVLKSCTKVAKDNLGEFAGRSSLHGIQYVGDTGKSRLERIFWLIAILLSLSGCSFMIWKQWLKWWNTPIIVTLSETSKAMWEIPFPAVTICPENKVKQNEFNFTKVLHSRGNKTDEEKEKIDQLELLCNSEIMMDMFFRRFEKYGHKNSINFTKNYIEEYAPKINDIMIACIWMGKGEYCHRHFQPVMTDEGYCFTFNGLNSNEMLNYPKFTGNFQDGPDTHNWNLDGRYTRSMTQDDVILNPLYSYFDYNYTYTEEDMEEENSTFPYRSNRSGSKGGLVIYLHLDENNTDYACTWPVLGFKVLLHHPADYPSFESRFFRVPLKRDVTASIQANIITYSPDIYPYSVKKRKCYFPKEKKLKYFKKYTMSNCELECHAKFISRHCGCQPFYFPNNESTESCKTYHWCYLLASEIISKGNIIRDECKCYPSCEEISYIPHVSFSQMVYPEVKWHIPDEYRNIHEVIGRLSIYFDDDYFITSRRSELFGYTDFLANVGGLLGLFSGFGVLSLVEIFYYISLCFARGARRFI